MNRIYIGTKTITTPNYFAEVVRETPKTLTVKIVDIDFSLKGSATGLKHTFSAGEKEWFSDQIGQQRKYWKETGKEIGSDFSYIV